MIITRRHVKPMPTAALTDGCGERKTAFSQASGFGPGLMHDQRCKRPPFRSAGIWPISLAKSCNPGLASTPGTSCVRRGILGDVIGILVLPNRRVDLQVRPVFRAPIAMEARLDEAWPASKPVSILLPITQELLFVLFRNDKRIQRRNGHELSLPDLERQGS